MKLASFGSMDGTNASLCTAEGAERRPSSFSKKLSPAAMTPSPGSGRSAFSASSTYNTAVSYAASANDACTWVKPEPLSECQEFTDPLPQHSERHFQSLEGDISASQKQQDLLSCRKKPLLDDLHLLWSEFHRFQTHDHTRAAEANDPALAARASKVEFFLAYIARMMHEIQTADKRTLQALEQQIQTNILPLKGKVLRQLDVAAAVNQSSESIVVNSPSWANSGESSAELITLSSKAGVVLRGTSEASQLSKDATTDASEDPLDDLDMTAFDLSHFCKTSNDADLRVALCPSEARLIEPTNTESSTSMMDVDITQPIKRAAEVCESNSSSTAEKKQTRRKPEPSWERREDNDPKVATKGIVEYQCILCLETYRAAPTCNPFWGLKRQECPKCHQFQRPRVDITCPHNNFEYHPALLAEAGDDESDDEAIANMSPEELLDRASHGNTDPNEPDEDDGIPLTPSQAAQLLVLLCHARTCPGLHHSQHHANVCRSAKCMILHVRDCGGKTLDGEPCAYAFCRPVKQLIMHLTRCYEPATCSVCRPMDLPQTLQDLVYLNWVRDSEQSTAAGMPSSPATTNSSVTSQEDCKPKLEDLLTWESGNTDDLFAL